MKRRKTALMMLSVLMVLAIFLSACSGSKSSSSSEKNQTENLSKAGIWLLAQSERQPFLTHYTQQTNRVQILNK